MIRRRGSAIALWGAAAAACVSLWSLVMAKPGVPNALADLQIYRSAVRIAFAGGSLYEYAHHTDTGRPEGFGFTYPPFAAIAFGPLAQLPVPLSDGLWSVATLLTVIGVAVVVARRLPLAERSSWSASAAMICLLLLVSMPVVADLLAGQVSLFLMALTLVDALVVPPRWRGVLTGVAGAVKVAPLAFAVYFVATRDWRALRCCAITFAAATALGLLVFPIDSLSYWTSRLWRLEYVGDPTVPANKSLNGLLLRWLGTPWAGTAWACCVALVVLAALRSISRHAAHGDRLSGAVIAGCVTAVIVPIAWPHHLLSAVVAASVLVFSDGWHWRLAGLASAWGLSLSSPLMDLDRRTEPILAVLPELPAVLMVAVAVCGLPFPSLPRRALRIRAGDRAATMEP